MIGLTEMALFSMLWMAWKKAGSKGVMTKERKDVYDNALEFLTDPEKLNKLAKAFDDEGFKTEAAMLRKRATLRAMPPEIKKRNRDIYDRAMQSTNVDAILALATAFEQLTATGAAKRLRDRAKTLKDSSTEPYDIAVAKPEKKVASPVNEPKPQPKTETPTKPEIVPEKIIEVPSPESVNPNPNEPEPDPNALPDTIPEVSPVKTDIDELEVPDHGHPLVESSPAIHGEE